MFQIVDYLTIYKKPWKELTDQERKSFNIFMLNKIFSMSEELIDIVNYSQTYSNLPPENVYAFWLRVLPKKKIRFNMMKKNKSDIDLNVISVLSNFFQVSKKQMEEDIKLMSEEDISKILNGSGIDKNKIKKILQ